ncbi:MAG TPA: hypothetical protein PKN75_04550 [Bacteroidia bacterium]|nr:hypothetical protein [Bacteroidia bacterium]HNU32841.1 hypothetical protein [Bacteroidia bacterium]
MCKRFFLLLLVVWSFNNNHSNAQSYNAYIRAGDKAIQSGDYYSATSYYFEALKINNDDAEVLYKMAEGSRMFNDYINAAKFYQQVVVKDKKSEFPLAVFWLARMKQFLGDYDNAKTLFSTYHSRNINNNDYYTNKAKTEMANCDSAKVIVADSLNVEIKNLGAPVNSVYSDFAAQQVADSVLYYSSLKFEIKGKKKRGGKKYVSRILRARNDDNKWKEPIELGKVNEQVMHNCNASISPDGKIMVYARCNYVGANLVCNLYESAMQNGQWAEGVKLPATINVPRYTSTQPCITSGGPDGYMLYYVTNRPDGAGKLDVWKVHRSANGVYATPSNIGNSINTSDDDISPFYDNKAQSLYFSSEGHNGLGGFDVYQSKFNGSDFTSPVNIGYPLNTSYNEVYFTSVKDSNYLFSSNRPGSMYIKARTCCYDIYSAKLFPKIISSVVDVKKDSAISNVTVKDSVYERNVFLKLYFDNDIPDSRTFKTTTQFNYEELYLDYVNRHNDYMNSFTVDLTDSQKIDAQQAMNTFFENKLEKGFKGLERFSAYVLKLLDEGNKVELKVRGSASPLANSAYNTNLSKRRIVSIINYWKEYKDEALNKYLKNKSLIITQEPVGENLTQKGLSDNLKDLRNSVYNPNVAMERYIEVVKFIVNGKEEY